LNNHANALVTFTGTTPNIGTTVAAFAAAYRVAELGGQPTGFLCMNLKSAKLRRYIGIDRPTVTLDGLRPELRSGTLTPEKLLRAASPLPNCPQLHVLFGNLLRDQAEFFTPEDMEHLIRIARAAFRLTVADVSAYWDNAATVTAMREGDTRVITTTTALSNFQEDGQRWIGQVSPLFGVPQAGLEGIIIHSPWRNGGFPVKDIKKETGLPIIGELRMTDSIVSQLDSGRLHDWLATDVHGKQAMRRTAEHLMAKHVITRKVDFKIQPWYRKLIVHRNEVDL